MKENSTIPVSCNKDCGAGCALTAYMDDGKIVKIADSPERPPYMRGCLKGYRSAETLYSGKRLTKPLIRSGERGAGRFRESTWEEAVELVAGKLQSLRNEGRSREVLRLGGSGSCRGALHNTVFTTQRFLSFYGPYTDTLGNYSCQASDYVKSPVFGTSNVGVDAATLLHSDHIILWGFNPFDTRFDSEVEAVLKEASKRGTAITVIDPRKTRTVKALGARWIPIKPGSDSAFMLAILRIWLDRGLVKRELLERYSRGFDQFEAYVRGESDGLDKTACWASALCGLSVEEIESFAMEYATARAAALLPGLSLQRAVGGENADRLGTVLQLAAGNAGIIGGSSGAGKWNRLKKPALGKLPVPENNQSAGVPVYLWADAVLEGKSGGFPSDISFLYNVGGNYLGQSSDTGKVKEAFLKADFSVTHDYFLTDTALYSDVVFPVTTFLEREDLVSTQNNYIFYSARAAEPVGESKNDYEIFSMLAERLGFGPEYTEGRSESQWLDLFLRESEIGDPEEFRRKGFYDGGEHERIGLADFFTDPHRFPLKTPSGKIEIASEKILSDGGTLLPEHILIETSEKFPLRMISPHEKYRIHSQNDNIPSLKKLCDDRLWIHRDDAAERGIGDGDTAEVAAPEGRITVKVRLTEDICRGCISLNQGVWALSGSEGANVNFLTSTVPTEPSKGSRTHSIIAEVKKLR